MTVSYSTCFSANDVSFVDVDGRVVLRDSVIESEILKAPVFQVNKSNSTLLIYVLRIKPPDYCNTHAF